MAEVRVIKANKNENIIRGKRIELKRVAAYCRVSTDSEEQLSSYKSQVQYYTDLINSKSDWNLVDIYADEAITGTQVSKRVDFQRLIGDCMDGKIDMVITKSISRFARNTLDTLKYVRTLKEKNVAVYFEDEKINTLTMDGELLLVVLSSVAQQEVENISANVKKGLKMKMQRGELTGFQGCLGYDYDPQKKTLTVNEKERKIIKYIFDRYVEGAGGKMIAHEIEVKGWKTKKGNSEWAPSAILKIIANEKYMGDVLLGKTFTVDPISKRRLSNKGEEDQFYIRDYHEPIVSREQFEKAQSIRAKRNETRHKNKTGELRQFISRKHAFSCMLTCGYCGEHLVRTTRYSGTKYEKSMWQCTSYVKKGKKECPKCKSIEEVAIEGAFLKSYQLLCANKSEAIDNFLSRAIQSFEKNEDAKHLDELETEIKSLVNKRERLLDLRLDDKIDTEAYEKKDKLLQKRIEHAGDQRVLLMAQGKNHDDVKKRFDEFRKHLHNGDVLEEFDRLIFESIIDTVIVGGYDAEGNEDPYKIIFVYKSGIKDELDGKLYRPQRRNAKGIHDDFKLYLFGKYDNEKLYLKGDNDTR